MDDFTIIGDSFEEELSNLEKQRRRETNISLSHEKCFTIMTKGIGLGHHVSYVGIRVDPTKIEVIVMMSTPNY